MDAVDVYHQTAIKLVTYKTTLVIKKWIEEWEKEEAKLFKLFHEKYSGKKPKVLFIKVI